MTLSDEISHSFFVLDEDRTGYLTLEQVYLLYVGLGYDPSVSQQELAVHVPQNRHEKVTLQDVQKILRFFPRQTSAEQLLDERFQLIDTDKHDVIQAGDLLKLAQAVGDDNLTMEQAQAMMAAVQSSTSYWTKEDLQEALRPRQQK